MNFFPMALLLIKPSMQFLKFLLSWIRQIYKAILLSSATWSNFSLLHHRPEKRLGLQDIPGPISFPIFGALWLYSRFGPYERSKYHLSNEDKFARYGPVVRESGFMNFPLIHLYHKDDILTVTKFRSDMPMRPHNSADVYYRQTRPDIYNNIGMVNENGEKWKELRSQLTPPLTKSPQNYASQICRIIDDFIDLLDVETDYCQGVLHGFQNQVHKVALEMVCTVALERRLGFIDQKINLDIQTIMNSLEGYKTASCEATYGIPWWQYLPKNFSGVFTNMGKHKDVLLDRIGQIVDETLDYEEAEGADWSEPKSIIRQLLENKSLDRKDIKASTVDYIIAGVDTIGNSIIFTVALIAQHPNVQKRLQEEVDHVLASGKELSVTTFHSMKYLRACVMETFRMYPTADQIARITETEIKVTGGYHVPAGSIVFCHHRLAALQEENFTRAREFIPERWLDNECDPTWNREAGLVLPFGFGKRACPGKRLAEVELYIMTAKLFHAYDVTLIDDLEVEFNFLLSPVGPLRMSLSRRQTSQTDEF